MKSLCLYIFAGILALAASTTTHECQKLGCTCPPDRSLTRVARDTTFDHKTKDGRVFGTLGQNNDQLYGRGGYEHNIFNDHRGDLKAQIHGTRVLGPYGDSSHAGGSLNWQNDNAKAAFGVNKEIHGRTTYDAQAGGHWPVGKNGELSAQGQWSKTEGQRSDYGVVGNYKYHF